MSDIIIERQRSVFDCINRRQTTLFQQSRSGGGGGGGGTSGLFLPVVSILLLDSAGQVLFVDPVLRSYAVLDAGPVTRISQLSRSLFMLDSAYQKSSELVAEVATAAGVLTGAGAGAGAGAGGYDSGNLRHSDDTHAHAHAHAGNSHSQEKQHWLRLNDVMLLHSTEDLHAAAHISLTEIFRRTTLLKFYSRRPQQIRRGVSEQELVSAASDSTSTASTATATPVLVAPRQKREERYPESGLSRPSGTSTAPAAALLNDDDGDDSDCVGSELDLFSAGMLGGRNELVGGNGCGSKAWISFACWESSASTATVTRHHHQHQHQHSVSIAVHTATDEDLMCSTSTDALGAGAGGRSHSRGAVKSSARNQQDNSVARLTALGSVSVRTPALRPHSLLAGAAPDGSILSYVGGALHSYSLAMPFRDSGKGSAGAGSGAGTGRRHSMSRRYRHRGPRLLHDVERSSVTCVRFALGYCIFRGFYVEYLQQREKELCALIASTSSSSSSCSSETKPRATDIMKVPCSPDDMINSKQLVVRIHAVGGSSSSTGGYGQEMRKPAITSKSKGTRSSSTFSAARPHTTTARGVPPSAMTVLLPIVRQLMASTLTHSTTTAYFLSHLELEVKLITDRSKFSNSDPEYSALMAYLYETEPLLLCELLSRLGRKLEPAISKKLFPVRLCVDMLEPCGSPHTASATSAASASNSGRVRIISAGVIALYESALISSHLHHAARLLSLACESVGGSEEHVGTVASLVLALELLHHSILDMSLRNALECFDFCVRLEAMIAFHSKAIFGDSGSIVSLAASAASRQGAAHGRNTDSRSGVWHPIRRVNAPEGVGGGGGGHLSLDSSYITTIKRKALRLITKSRGAIVTSLGGPSGSSGTGGGAAGSGRMMASSGHGTGSSGFEESQFFTPMSAASPALPYYLGAGVVWAVSRAFGALSANTSTGTSAGSGVRCGGDRGQVGNGSGKRGNYSSGFSIHPTSADGSAGRSSASGSGIGSVTGMQGALGGYRYAAIDIVEAASSPDALCEMLCRAARSYDPAYHSTSPSVAPTSTSSAPPLGHSQYSEAFVASTSASAPSPCPSPTVLLLVCNLRQFFQSSSHYCNVAVLMAALLRSNLSSELISQHVLSSLPASPTVRTVTLPTSPGGGAEAEAGANTAPSNHTAATASSRSAVANNGKDIAKAESGKSGGYGDDDGDATPTAGQGQWQVSAGERIRRILYAFRLTKAVARGEDLRSRLEQPISPQYVRRVVEADSIRAYPNTNSSTSSLSNNVSTNNGASTGSGGDGVTAASNWTRQTAAPSVENGASASSSTSGADLSGMGMVKNRGGNGGHVQSGPGFVSSSIDARETGTAATGRHELSKEQRRQQQQVWEEESMLLLSHSADVTDFLSPSKTRLEREQHAVHRAATFRGRADHPHRAPLDTTAGTDTATVAAATCQDQFRTSRAGQSITTSGGIGFEGGTGGMGGMGGAGRLTSYFELPEELLEGMQHETAHLSSSAASLHSPPTSGAADCASDSETGEIGADARAGYGDDTQPIQHMALSPLSLLALLKALCVALLLVEDYHSAQLLLHTLLPYVKIPNLLSLAAHTVPPMRPTQQTPSLIPPAPPAAAVADGECDSKAGASIQVLTPRREMMDLLRRGIPLQVWDRALFQQLLTALTTQQ